MASAKRVVKPGVAEPALTCRLVLTAAELSRGPVLATADRKELVSARTKTMSKLERGAYVSMIVVSMAALYSLVLSGFSRRVHAPAKPVVETGLVGKKLRLDAVPWSQSQTAIVLAITSQCPYCLRSLPLYRKLDKIVRESHSSVSLFVVSPEPLPVMEGFLADEQIKPGKVFHSPLAEVGLRATPTVLLVDESGTVRHVFVGQLDEAKERQLLALLNSAAPVQGLLTWPVSPTPLAWVQRIWGRDGGGAQMPQ